MNPLLRWLSELVLRNRLAELHPVQRVGRGDVEHPLRGADGDGGAEVPMLDHDRHFHPDMEAANALVRRGTISEAAGLALPGIA